MKRSALVWVVLAIGCRSEKATVQSDTATTEAAPLEEPAPPESPSTYEYDGEADAPVYDRAALETALDDLLANLLQYTGDAPLAGYASLIAQADETCPTWYETDGNVYWTGGCTSSTGTYFSGYMFTEEQTDAPLMGETSVMSGMTLNGQAFMTAADGTRLDLAGSTYSASGTIENGEGWMTGVVGSFSWTDEAAADTWMGGPVEPNLEMQGFRWTYDQVYRGVGISGGLSGFSDGWNTAYLDEVLALDDLGGYWPCPEEPTGIVSVRNPEGHWYQVVFDIEATDDGFTMPEGTCDGCGTVFQNGIVVGEVCTDFSVLLDWEDRPW